MPEFTDLVRQRLALSRPVDLHPDADILTAYAEKLLPAADRDIVVEHLALCSECREVIALVSTTAAEAEPAIGVAAAPIGRARRAWAPLFGLAASFVAVAVIAVLLVRAPQQAHSGATASNAVPSSPAQEKVNEPAPSPQPSAEAEVVRNEQAPSRPAAATVTRARRAEPGAVMAGSRLADREMPAPPPVIDAGRAAESSIRVIAASASAPSKQDYVNSQMFASAPAGNQNQNVPTAADIPNAPSRNAVVGGNLQLPTMVPLSQGTNPTQETASSSEHGRDYLKPFKQLEHIMRKQPPAINANGLAFSTMGGVGQFNPARDKSQSAEVAARAAKAETAELDQSQAFTSRALSPAAAGRIKAASEPSWSVGTGKLYKTDETGAWTLGYSGTENVEFSAVTFSGSEVWAAGNHGTLLHSVDSGGSWEKLRVSGNVLGKITSISARGPNVHVTTSEGQGWSSEDSGKTWTQD